MSFFANLLGGTLQGVGGGMSAMAVDDEKLQVQRALLQDKQQAALELQQQRTADRQWQQEQTQALQMKAAAGGTGGGGVGAGGRGRAGSEGINLARMAYDARTPEEQQRVIALVDSFHGNDAAGVLAERMYGTPRMTRTEPTAGDFARHDRAGDMQAAPPTTTLERAQYDADKGVQALQRAYAMFMEPGRPAGYAATERSVAAPDAGVGQALQRGTPQVQDASGTGSYTATAGGAGDAGAKPGHAPAGYPRGAPTPSTGLAPTTQPRGPGSPALTPAARGDAWRAKVGFKG